MERIDIAEVVRNTDMYELACKTNYGLETSENEQTVIAQLDKRFKEIGAAGNDPHNEIGSFITKVINTEIYDTPDDLLDTLFDRGTIGTNDDFNLVVDPKNTLVSYDAAPGGNVPRSFLDVSVRKPHWNNKQIETDISFADVEKNGWKTIAKYTEFSVAEFKNAMFLHIFSVIDDGIATGAENCITEGGAMPTQATMDALALYVNDRANGDGVAVGMSKYIQAASKLTGFVSEDMINEVHRNGRLGVYDAVSLYPISAAKKLGNGANIFPDKRIYGISGKIGTLNMKGEVKVLQEEDINKEVFHLKFANFTYGYAFNDDALENVCKVVLA